MTLTLGWWLIPTAITFITFGFCYIVFKDEPADEFGKILTAFVKGIYYGSATIISLIAWFVWALLK